MVKANDEGWVAGGGGEGGAAAGCGHYLRSGDATELDWLEASAIFLSAANRANPLIESSSMGPSGSLFESWWLVIAAFMPKACAHPTVASKTCASSLSTAWPTPTRLTTASGLHYMMSCRVSQGGSRGEGAG